MTQYVSEEDVRGIAGYVRIALTDDELVQFASACAGVAVSRYPMQLDPPRLAELDLLIKQSQTRR